ncbi:MAG: DUF3313 domain-containing protein [Desulfobacteraceae bacterium]|nr:DUF3313 domain-containing protein [Desulfobacteraceae bacterium]
MKILRQIALFLSLAAMAVGGGCAETKQAKNVQPSGFLGDYSLLRPGKGDEALLRYRNPAADIKKYRKIMIVPVRIFQPKGASEAQKADLQKLAGNFNVYLTRELEKDYQIVQTPGPDTMKIESAITGAEKSGRGMDLVSSALPIGMVLSAGKDFATGKPTGVGEISMEMRVTDAATGELLGEAVDRRVGGKNPSGMFDAWNDANQAMQYWAKQLAYVLCRERGSGGCVKP